jgi:hypothetical protein
MNMPRFTAEASLYKTSGRYQQVAIPAIGARRQEVIPQRSRWICSDDGHLCFHCIYADNTGRLIYCDVYWLPLKAQYTSVD